MLNELQSLLDRATAAIRRSFSDDTPQSATQKCGLTKKCLRSVKRSGGDVFARNADGGIKAQKVGGPFGITHGGAPGVTFVAEKYELELKNGQKISAYKSLGRLDETSGKIVPDARMETDCHGVTFTDGQYWIDNDQVDAMLAGGGFKPQAKARAGDVLVYRDGTGDVVHSVTVTKVGADGKATEVSGLGGIEMAEHADPPGSAWYDPKATMEVWGH